VAATESSGAAANFFEVVTPILRVRELSASVQHYVHVLGFRVDWTDEGMVSVSRDRCSLMLCEGAQGNPGTWVWIGVADAGALHAEYRASGAAVRLEPTDFPWAYEMQVTDPDGHVLRFGSEPRAAGRPQQRGDP
jgi:predicted enzyme related to lactoylglutathione lyase